MVESAAPHQKPRLSRLVQGSSHRLNAMRTPSTNILGISAFYHDSAARLVDGDIVAAAQEERFTERSTTLAFPSDAVDYCLKKRV